MDHWTAKAALDGLTYEGVWGAGTNRSPGNRARRDEAEATTTTRRRARFAPRRAHARPTVGAHA
jgi:hypothetical protein